MFPVGDQSGSLARPGSRPAIRAPVAAGDRDLCARIVVMKQLSS
jgi:hypothetical protein